MTVSQKYAGLMNGAGLLIGLLGLASSFYFYLQTIEYVRPTFLVDPQRTVLVERSGLANTPIHVVRADGTPVDGDVSSVRLYFWNAGNKAIRVDDVLVPISIDFSSTAEILDFKIVAAPRPKVTQFAVARTEDQKNRLRVTFRILEPEDGGTVQVLLAGDRRTLPTASGAIAGAREITTNATVAKSRYWVEYLRPFAGVLAMAAFIGLLNALGGGWKYLVKLSNHPQPGVIRLALQRAIAYLRKIAFPTLLLFMVGVLVLLVWLFASVAPHNAQEAAQKSVTSEVPLRLLAH